MSDLAVSKNQGSIQQSSWGKEQLEIIKSQIALGCSDGELSLFSEVCKSTGLNPFTRQIYAISRKGKMTIQISIDGFRLIADRSGKYAGSETFWCADDGIWRDVWLSSAYPAAAKVCVYKLGIDRPFVGVARWESYRQEFYDKSSSKKKIAETWHNMPDVMLSKCAESLALRKAFPAELSGLYTKEEMDQADQADDLRESRPPTSEDIPYVVSKPIFEDKRYLSPAQIAQIRAMGAELDKEAYISTCRAYGERLSEIPTGLYQSLVDDLLDLKVATVFDGEILVLGEREEEEEEEEMKELKRKADSYPEPPNR